MMNFSGRVFSGGLFLGGGARLCMHVRACLRVCACARVYSRAAQVVKHFTEPSQNLHKCRFTHLHGIFTLQFAKVRRMFALSNEINGATASNWRLLK